MMDKQFITFSNLKAEFKLTDKLIRMIGEPDTLKPNPHYKAGSPMKLYYRSRVENWIAEHQNEITKAQARKNNAKKAVETKREFGRREIAKLINQLRMNSIAGIEKVRKEARKFFYACYEDFSGEVTEKGLCAFIRHNYTNYEEILDVVKGKVGASDLYQNVKVYLCCQIIDNYKLDVDPLYAAFGEEAIYNEIPDRFVLRDDTQLKLIVAEMIGVVT